jgi:hypothetical protein
VDIITEILGTNFKKIAIKSINFLPSIQIERSNEYKVNCRLLIFNTGRTNIT